METKMDSLVKIDLHRMCNCGQPVIIELGCGRKKKEGRIGIDILDLPDVDIVADVENGLPFLPDQSVDRIYRRSIIEHIQNVENLIREIVRVLKNAGTAHIFVPHFSNPYYYSDYTHKRFFGLYTFYYFVDKEHQLKRKVPDSYTNVRINIISQRFVFTSPFPVRRKIKTLFGSVFNLHRSLQEFYEENRCYIVPCYGIELVVGRSY